MLHNAQAVLRWSLSAFAIALLISLSCKASQAADATLPVAPTPQNFMWQTLQEQFLDEAGGIL